MCHGKTDYTHPLRPFGITGLNDAEDEMARAIWIEPDGKFMVHPRRFIECVRKATTKAGRCVFIGSDKASRAPSRLGKVVLEKPPQVIHLTSRTAPSDAKKVERPAEMLHDELIVGPEGFPSAVNSLPTDAPCAGPPVDRLLLFGRKSDARTRATVAGTGPVAGGTQALGTRALGN
jgi:hypothetical protein